MVQFWPFQQELNCINDAGDILGKIVYDISLEQYLFQQDSESKVLSDLELINIENKVRSLNTGNDSVPAQDDD